jgi:hypothetical protein
MGEPSAPVLHLGATFSCQRFVHRVHRRARLVAALIIHPRGVKDVFRPGKIRLDRQAVKAWRSEIT